MTRDDWWLIAFVIYGIISGLVPAILWARKVKRRGGRAPVAFKLLRGPGETIRRRMAKSDENIAQDFLVLGLGPPCAALSAMLMIVKLLPSTVPVFWGGIGLGLIVLVVTTWLAGRKITNDLTRYRNDRLGYLGEREVAEHLRPLLARGYQVFHDVPAEGAKADFNLDHVAVGPAGVAVIEVKTRRKGRARPGMKDHVVGFDGNQLSWPWGEDRHGLDQALNEADWLQKFIFQRTGIDTPVKPILALPGWFVEAKARGVVTVVNSKNVAMAVEGYGKVVLSAKEIDLIARQLDERCRDVED